MRIDAPIITGSFSLNGDALIDLNVLTTTGSNTFIGNQSIIGAISASALTGSIDFTNLTNSPTLVSGSSQIVGILSPLNTFSASNGNESLNSYTSSQDTKNTTLGSYTGSNDTKWTSIGNLTGSYATTGSNTFYGTQVFSGSVFIATDLIVQGSSSIQYISASSVSIGTNIVQLNTATPSVRYAGISVQDSGSSAGVTGSMLWDSLCNRWIYSNPSGVGYSGGMLLSGPRASTLGTETTLTCNYIAKSGGGDHLYDSCISDDGTTVCVNGNFVGTGTACFGSCVTLSTTLGVGRAPESDVAILVKSIGTTSCTYAMILQDSGTNNLFIVKDSGAACFAGQVCVGNASIATRSLVIQAGSTNQAIMFKNCWGGDGTLYACGNATAFHYGFNTYSCGDVLFIANGGNVGLSCNNPGYTLDVNGTGHFSSAGGTMLIESTQPTNASTLKIIQCSNGGNGNTDQGLVVQTNAGDGTSNIAHFYDYNSGTPLSRFVVRRNGNIGIGSRIPAAKLYVYGNIRSAVNSTYYSTFNYSGGTYLEMMSPVAETADNFVFNICGAGSSTTGNCFIFKTQAGNTTPSQVLGINKNGVAIFSSTLCASSFIGSSVRGNSNLDLNGNSGYLTLRTGDVTRLFVGSTGGVSVGAVSDPGLNNFIVAGTICSGGITQAQALIFSAAICGSGTKLGTGGANTGYTSDGIWGATATPNYISTAQGGTFRLGYTDNGSGLYGSAYGFDVSYKDGLNRCIDYDAILMRNAGQGTVPFRVTSYGNIYGVSKNFRIKHPLPSMNDTHYLIHTSIEGPQADLIYRGKVQLVDGKAEVNIDLASRMTDGTFEVLCQDVQSYTTNESGWSLTKSYVVGNILHIEAQDETSTDIISWLVIGERNDDGIKNSAITDENGHVIVEELKPEEGL